MKFVIDILPCVEFLFHLFSRVVFSSHYQVRIFRPENVTELLKESLTDYVQVSVGITNKGKLLVPKLLHCYAKGNVEDSMLRDWICQFLSPEQAAMVRDCSPHQKRSLLGTRGFSVLPFDSRFRYLFLMQERNQ